MDQPRLIAQDADLWILHKPSGMPVHPAGDGREDLMGWASQAFGDDCALAPINRLDLETSGLVMCSPDAGLRGELGRALATGLVEKAYMALVHGRTNRKGIIRRALKDGRRGKAIEAVTRYKAVRLLGPVTLLRVRPETGRKHQIRRHLQSVGHAIVGDERYPPERFRPVAGFPGRLWLHACALTLPDGREFVDELPPELEAHLALLESLNEGS